MLTLKKLHSVETDSKVLFMSTTKKKVKTILQKYDIFTIYIRSELNYSKIIFYFTFSFYLTTLFRAEESPVSSEVERSLGKI